MTRCIAVANQKGGCGKTTATVNLAAGLAAKEKNVLLIDLDPQGHAALGLGIDPESVELTTYDVLNNSAQSPLGEVQMSLAENLFLLPSNVLLSTLEQELSEKPGRENRLREALEQAKGQYDYILIDCPPSLGLLTFNALRASTEVLVPCGASRFSEHGLRRLTEIAALLQDRFGQSIQLQGILMNFDNRSAFARMIARHLHESFPGFFLKTVIHVSSRIREAAFHGKSVIDFDRYCRSTKEFEQLCDELIAQESAMAPRETADRSLSEVSLRDAVPSRAVDHSHESEQVLFRVHAPGARKVSIAGSFNSWQPNQYELRGPDEEGYWYAELVLPKGTHSYKYVVDDAWDVDPENPIRENDGFGGINSVIEI